MLIFIVGSRPDAWREFREVLVREPGTVVETAETGASVLEMIKSRPPALVIIDYPLPDFKPFALVLEIIKINAMVQTAVVSSLSDEEFHEKSEGLGIMAHFPSIPTASDAPALMDRLNS
jgi:DNA-binding response OmpR family regulator